MRPLATPRTLGIRKDSTPRGRGERTPRTGDIPLTLDKPTRATRAILTTSATEFAEAATSAIRATSASGATAGVSLLAIAVDEAGQQNGHAPALREQVVELIRRNLRGNDVVSFASAEEVLVLLHDVDADRARHVAERVAAAVRNHGFAGSVGDRGRVALTASIGLVSAPANGADIYLLTGAARTAREAVSTAGGDGVAVAPLDPAGRPVRRLDTTRFIGRTEELAALRRWLDESLTGSPRAVAVVGDAGSGRATLIQQIEPEVRLRGGSVIVARARNSDVRPPYGVWTDVLLALQRLPDVPVGAWREILHLHPGIAGTSEERAGSKYRLLEEISEYIRLAARARPLVIVLDEMQWADAASWDALDYLLTQVERERLMLCLTVRDSGEPDVANRRKSLERIEAYKEIRLSRLTRDEVKRWVEFAMHRQEVGRELLAYLYRQTEGSPLFMTQLARCLVEEGDIRFTGDRWEWSAVSEMRPPSGLHDILERRLLRLSPATQDILRAASMIGRQFDEELLLAASGASAADVRHALAEATAVDLVLPHYERGGGGFQFIHWRLADAFASTMPPDRVLVTHERIARALERRPAAAARAAIHFDRAGLAADAYKWALEAGAHAEGIYAYDTAGEFLQIAARSAMSPAELAEVRVRMAHLAETFGRFDEVEELCDLAIEWFSGQGDRLRALTLRRMRERARRELGQPASNTLDALRALDEEAKVLGSDEERIEILTMESQTFSRLGDPQRAEKLAEECVEMAERLGDPALLAASLNRLAVTVRNENPARARTYFERALEMFQRLGNVRGQAWCHNNLGIVAQLEMRPDYGRDSLTMAMTLAKAAGMPDVSGLAALNLGVITQRVGDTERARDLYGEALAQFAAVKNSELQLYALYNMANLERETGAYENGAELYEATSSLARRIGQSDVEIGAMAGEGLCLLAIGRTEGARVQSSEIAQRLQDRPTWFQGRELVETLQIRILATEGRITEAMSMFESSQKRAEEFDMYSVAWLTAACADLLLPHYPEPILAAIEKYSGQVASLGFADLVRKYKSLQGLPSEPTPA